MNITRIIQIGLIVFIAGFAFLGDVFDPTPTEIEAAVPEARWSWGWGFYPYRYYYYAPYYYRPYYPVVRTYAFPRNAYRSQLELTVEDDGNQKVTEVYMDGRSVPLVNSDSSGYKGSYYYVISPGVHTVEWRVEGKKLGIISFSNYYRRQFQSEYGQPMIRVRIKGSNFFGG